MGGSFWTSGPPELTFFESKRCQFLSILFMGQDVVFQKTHLENGHFLGDTCIFRCHFCYLEKVIQKAFYSEQF